MRSASDDRYPPGPVLALFIVVVAVAVLGFVTFLLLATDSLIGLFTDLHWSAWAGLCLGIVGMKIGRAAWRGARWAGVAAVITCAVPLASVLLAYALGARWPPRSAFWVALAALPLVIGISAASTRTCRAWFASAGRA